MAASSEPVTFMCRMSALAATALVLSLASPALARAPEAKSAPAQAATPAPAAQPAPPRKASAEERAMAQRLDPLARAAFWAREADLDPMDAEAGVGLSQALRAMGRYDEALNAAQRVLLAKPDAEEALLEEARAQIGKGQGFYAIEPARQAQAKAPTDWRPAALMAIAYDQAGRPDEALEAHRQAIALAPENPTPLANLALYYAAHGDAAQAETLLRAAAAKPGATMAVRQNLALILGLQGRFDEAEKIARQDLPPEVVASNMTWLRNAAAGPQTAQRSWDSVRTAQ
jgi:Flp pilus assembly protein TadD